MIALRPLVMHHPIRKPCLACGRSMKLVSGEDVRGGEHYVCVRCDQDPLHDPAARRWIESPLEAPAKT